MPLHDWLMCATQNWKAHEVIIWGVLMPAPMHPLPPEVWDVNYIYLLDWKRSICGWDCDWHRAENMGQAVDAFYDIEIVPSWSRWYFWAPHSISKVWSSDLHQSYPHPLDKFFPSEWQFHFSQGLWDLIAMSNVLSSLQKWWQILREMEMMDKKDVGPKPLPVATPRIIYIMTPMSRVGRSPVQQILLVEYRFNILKPQLFPKASRFSCV